MAMICHNAYQRFGVFPNQIMQLPDRERAFIVASDLIVAAEQAKRDNKRPTNAQRPQTMGKA